MVDPFTKGDIDNCALQLLKSSKAFDIFPTPVDSIIQYAELAVATGIDLSKVEKSFFLHFPDIGKILSKVRGALIREERTIYLDLSQIPSRRNFIKLHECGHHVLPWQKSTFDLLDDDNTLHPSVKEEFESQANYFASAMLFQLDRFETEMNKLGLHIDSAMYLARHFGASNHAALRRYVELHRKRCSLLVLEKDPLMGQRPEYKVRDYFQSGTFTASFDTIEWPEYVGYTWPFVKDFYFKRKKTEGLVTLSTANGSSEFSYNFFDNSYNGFVLLFPVGEKQKTKTKIVLSGKKPVV